MSWMVRIDGAVLRKIFGCFSMMLARWGGMLTATSISPFCSAATRTASSGIGRNTTVLIFGAPFHQPVLASSTISSSLAQRTNLYGPVPIGWREMSAGCLSLYAFGGYIDACANVIKVRNVGHGLFVCTRTV